VWKFKTFLKFIPSSRARLKVLASGKLRSNPLAGAVINIEIFLHAAEVCKVSSQRLDWVELIMS
jgi:hypothetical protein